jgi:anti-sigma-K factor RskA
MSDTPTPEELRKLLGAFALDAVDDDERAQVEELVLHDPDARAELHRLQHAVAWLGHASPRPSPAAWDAVATEMARDVAADAVTPTGDTTVVPIDARRRRPRWLTPVAVAASMVLIVGIAIAVITTTSGGGGRTTTVALAAPDGRVAVTARVGADGHGRIVSSALPAAPAGHEYQLWVQPAPTTSMRSAGLLGRDPDGRRITVPGHPDRMAISVEPTGGSRAPTTNPVAVSGTDPV